MNAFHSNGRGISRQLTTRTTAKNAAVITCHHEDPSTTNAVQPATNNAALTANFST